jgi:translation initiation factor 1
MTSRNSDRSSSPNGRRVYSTEVGRTCPGCLRAQAQCICKSVHNTLQATGADDGIVRLHRERKGRKGKGVTLIKGLALTDPELAALAKTLKSSCGVGGSVKAGVIELQTHDREKIKTLLEAQGHSAKIAGG